MPSPLVSLHRLLLINYMYLFKDSKCWKIKCMYDAWSQWESEITARKPSSGVPAKGRFWILLHIWSVQSIFIYQNSWITALVHNLKNNGAFISTLLNKQNETPLCEGKGFSYFLGGFLHPGIAGLCFRESKHASFERVQLASLGMLSLQCWVKLELDLCKTRLQSPAHWRENELNWEEGNKRNKKKKRKMDDKTHSPTCFHL